jgi:hypothetical protein
MFEGQNSILHCIKWCIKIVRSSNISCHLLGWFDTAGGGWVGLGLHKRVSAGKTWWMFGNAKGWYNCVRWFFVRHLVLPYVFLHQYLSLITVTHMHRTLQPCSSNQCNTAHLESKLTCQFKTCSSHPMKMNTRFWTRLNASYTDDYVIVPNNDSAIRGL